MRFVLLVLAVGCSGTEPPVNPVGPPPTVVGGRLLVTWDVFDSVALTVCPEEYRVRVAAPPDTVAYFRCADLEGIVDPAPIGQYVVALDLLDAADDVVDSASYGVLVELGSEDAAYAAFLLP